MELHILYYLYTIYNNHPSTIRPLSSLIQLHLCLELLSMLMIFPLSSRFSPLSLSLSPSLSLLSSLFSLLSFHFTLYSLLSLSYSFLFHPSLLMYTGKGSKPKSKTTAGKASTPKGHKFAYNLPIDALKPHTEEEHIKDPNVLG